MPARVPRFAQQDAVFEPGGVAEVMGHEACPGHAEDGLAVPRSGLVGSGSIDMSVSPRRASRWRPSRARPGRRRAATGRTPRQDCHRGRWAGHRRGTAPTRPGNSRAMSWVTHSTSLPGRGDTEEDHLGDALRMGFGVGQAEGRAPRCAEEKPALDAQVLPQALDVGDQVVGRVRGQIDLGVAGVGRAPAAAALVEEDDPVGGGVEVAPPAGRAARAGAAVEDDGRLAVGIPQVSQ